MCKKLDLVGKERKFAVNVGSFQLAAVLSTRGGLDSSVADLIEEWAG